MAQARLMWRNASDSGTLTPSSEGYQLDADNLALVDRGTLWQTGTSTAAETVTVDLGSAESIQAFYLLDHDLTASDTLLTIAGNSADSWGSPAFSQSVTWRETHLVEFFSAAQSYRYWRFSFTKSAAGETRQASRLYLGPYYSLDLDRGTSWGRRSLTERGYTRGGQLHTDLGAYLRTLDTRVSFMTSAVETELRTLAATFEDHTPFALSVDHDVQPVDYLLYGTLTRLTQPYGTYDATHRWHMDLAMEETL